MNTKRLFTLSFVIIALIALGSIHDRATPEEGIEVSYIDVDQGGSALIGDLSGFDVLIDEHCH